MVTIFRILVHCKARDTVVNLTNKCESMGLVLNKKPVTFLVIVRIIAGDERKC